MIRVLELFGGIGAFSKALERQGIEHEIVDYVEIDKFAVQSFNAIHNTHFKPQDITKWDKDIDVDVIMHGSPCQDFSIAGKQAGGDKDTGTRSSLMYETLRIVQKLKPKYVIWENVKNLLSKKHHHNFQAYQDAMAELGYTNYYKVLNAKDYGVPQNRERVFTVSIRNDLNVDFKFPEPQELTVRLKDVLEPQVDEKYYLSDEQTERLKMTTYNAGSEKARAQNTDGKARTLCARDYKDLKCVREPIIIDDYNQRVRADQDTMGTLTTNCGASAPRNGFKIAEPQAELEQPIYGDYKDPKCVRVGGLYDKDGSRHQAGSIYDPNGICATLSTMQGGNRQPKIDGIRIRKLTPKECWRFMGFDDSDFEKAEKVNSNTQLYKQAGNSIVVNVLESILNNLFINRK